MPVEPTEFQQRILAYVVKAPNQMASAREVAACAFPERWAKRTGRGALVGHVAKAGDVLVSMGLLACVLGPKDRWGSPKLCGGFKTKNTDEELDLKIENLINGFRNYGYRVDGQPVPDRKQELIEELRKGLRNAECILKHIRGSRALKLKILHEQLPEPCFGVVAN